MSKVLCLILLLALASAYQKTFEIVSDTTTFVRGSTLKGSSTSYQTKASPVRGYSRYWDAQIPGAMWIWDNADSERCVFYKRVYTRGTISYALLDLAADDGVQTYFNGKSIGCDADRGTFTKATQLRCDVTQFVSPGLKVIEFHVTNIRGPAGLLYKLTLIAESNYDN